MCHRCSEQEREQEQHKPNADPSMTVAVTGINILIKTTTCEKYTKDSLENFLILLITSIMLVSCSS